MTEDQYWAACAKAHAATSAQHKGQQQGPGAGVKRRWFAKLRQQKALCLRCQFESGVWLGYTPAAHACGKTANNDRSAA